MDPMHFTMICNMLQIFTLEGGALFRNVLTRFSQLQVFVALLRHFGTFSPVHLLMHIKIRLFYSKDESFL